MEKEAQELLLQLPHITLGARAWGPEDGIPVLALHGWLDNAASFDPMAAHLAGIRLVALDFAGHGRSAHRPAGVFYHMVDNAFDVISVADRLGWDSFSLLGHSMGGIIATFVAGSFPGRVQRLGLIESLGPYVNAPQEAPAQLAKAIAEMEALAEKKLPCYPSLEDAVDARLRGFGSIGREAAQLLVERGLVREPTGYSWCTDPRLKMSSPFRFTEEMVTAFLQAIAAPVLLVTGDQGFMPRYAAHEGRLAHLRDVSVHQFEGGHHLHMEEAAGDIGELMRDFFAAQ